MAMKLDLVKLEGTITKWLFVTQQEDFPNSCQGLFDLLAFLR
jgi:hypothetical protein